MKRVNLLSFTIFIITATSTLSSELPLEKGYFKWLLHLGQNPTDRILGSGNLEFMGKEGTHRPTPGEIYNFSNTHFKATTDLMIWTPQYSETGSFTHEALEGQYTHYYHIYIISPDTRNAHLKFIAAGGLMIWNNGQILFDGWPSLNREQQVDIVLAEGFNSMTFRLLKYDQAASHLAVMITDRNGIEFSDLTYSMEPSLPDVDIYIVRHLTEDYDPGSTIDVELEVIASNQLDPNELRIVEYVPQGTSVADTGGAKLIHNSLWWTVPENEIIPGQLRYSLNIPSDQTGPIPFSGYHYKDKEFTEIAGDKAVFENPPLSPASIADSIETIDFLPGEYSSAEGITIGSEFAEDYSGSLVNYGRGLVSGLKSHQTGGWAEYEFSVTNPGQYQIILDYGELWTMYHYSAPVKVAIDGNISLDTELYPTTHCYGWSGEVVYGPSGDPERKALWDIGSVHLSSGQHTLRLIFPPMYSSEQELDQYTDGRTVVTRIIMTNYPGLILPGMAEPCHLDSYEHPPAMIVRDREIMTSADGRLTMTFHGTFYSLSQGNELYFVDPHIWPKQDSKDSRFEILSVEPQVFHLPPEGQQDFILTVRSKETEPDDYSEFIVLWLQGVPSCPARKPYLFTTTQQYITLPPWEHSESFWMVDWLAWYINRDILDPPNAFLPKPEDLGFKSGRYTRGPVDYLRDQLQNGKLLSVADIFDDNQWPYDQPQVMGDDWNAVWSSLIGSLYSRDGTGLQAKAYALYLAENMVFYPVKRRWDWARVGYTPNMNFTTDGFPALLLPIRAAREQLLSDDEQFYLLHNLVLPIFNSYCGELRVVLTLEQNAKEGDTILYVSRSTYGDTGSPTDGLHFGSPYIKIDGDAYRMGQASPESLIISEPLRRNYPKGTKVVSWPYSEGLELEAMDLMSLLAIGTAGRDPALIDQVMAMYSEIVEKQQIMLSDGSFRNEPGSYGSMGPYMQTLLDAQEWLGRDLSSLISPTLEEKFHQAIINISQFPFSNGKIPHLNGGGCMNQLNGWSFREIHMLEKLFPEDQEHIELYKRIELQETNRVPGDIIDNHNFVVHGWGYAMLRSENGSWDRGMETLLSSKYLRSNPGDHVSCDSLGLVVYGLGAILTPRYGYSWIGYAAPLLNQVMVDNDPWDNAYYGSFWHFDGRNELPSAVAHTGDGIESSLLNRDMSRWCIQFPEYLFDAYFVQAKDPNVHQYDWCFINMGELELIEPTSLSWEDYPEFLDGYWPEQGTRGAGNRTIASKGSGRIVADWIISNSPWVPDDDPTLLRESPQHSGRLRLIMADDSPSQLIDAQIGYYRQWNGEQTLANSQDVLVVRKLGIAHVFVNTLESIADDEESYVKNVVVIAKGNHNQQLVKVTTIEGEDWVYLSGHWGVRPNGDQPVSGITTDADILAWRVVNNKVIRFYLAGGSYAHTVNGSWDFGSQGNYYTSD